MSATATYLVLSLDHAGVLKTFEVNPFVGKTAVLRATNVISPGIKQASIDCLDATWKSSGWGVAFTNILFFLIFDSNLYI